MSFFNRDSQDRIVSVKARFWVMFAVIVLLVVTAFQGFGVVPAGYRGVHLRFGALTNKIYNEGLYFKIPFIEDVRLVSVRIQKIQANADAASKDLQTVDATIALNYHVQPDKTAYLYQNVPGDYQSTLITPAIQEVVKASMAIFNAEQLITKRTEVRDLMRKSIEDKLNKYGIIIDEFNIENFNFSDSFDSEVEAKVTAEQRALAAQNRLEQIKFEAQQQIEAAKGSAEAIRIEAQALIQNPMILQLRSIEKWNGELPKVLGTGSVPFIDLQL